MKNIIFIGMPAVGKSTVGVVVAKRLGYEFIDTDLLIQKQENRLLREIIAEEGLDGFLRIENQVNRDVEAEHAVISPGGSVVYCEEAMKHYKEIGTIVYLHAVIFISDDIIAQVLCMKQLFFPVAACLFLFFPSIPGTSGFLQSPGFVPEYRSLFPIFPVS